MINYLINKFIKNNQDYDNPQVREKYGTLSSILSIICNLVLVVFKFFVGFFTNSVAIQADAFNNLSDVGSNFASLFGFKLANKHPDSDHPYGHGRMEYIAGLVIAFLILLVGLQSIRDSFLKIITPEKVTFSIVAVVILIISILIKLWMSYFNNYIGKKINSQTLLAASKDSKNDVVATLATLISLCLSLVTDLPIDGIMGILVSMFVIKAGIEVCHDTTDPLLGQAPDPKLVKSIVDYVNSYDVVLGIHDLMMHDYGPGRKFITMHVEVDGSENIMAVHDSIDLIERDINNKYNILTTIHMDPIITDDKLTSELKTMVSHIVKSIDDCYSIHDFRIVDGPTHTNLIFDILIPADDEIPHKELKRMVTKKIQEKNSKYFTVIQIDHNFV